MKTTSRFLPSLFLAIFLGACGGSPASKPEAPAASTQSGGSQPSNGASATAPAGPQAGAATNQAAVPQDIQDAATAALGADTEALLHGDLALNGHDQILAINRVKGGKDAKIPGNMATRVVILEKDGGVWKQVFLCEQYLKNPKGFLGATPLAAVPAWRLQYEQNAEKGLILYFTPLEKPAGGYVTTIGVRWNAKVKRYQSLDRTYENFLGETPALNTP